MCRGFSFGYSAWINEQFLGSGQGTSIGQDGEDILNATFTFDEGALYDDENGASTSCPFAKQYSM